ncbi:MAG: hydrogenase maturation nickel metallochaperone HypA [Deltaproteobacteria bacterium]|nr:MAG: hydrogenase maturation nickel metallochaperone HypA [Deltaproteobacteria bacterium]TMQ14088.1 MAG: hydrogenase maturation nickel metallochaperone HypA [Deltaproteobacteria bacterium]
MHEYSIIAALVDRVRRETEARPGATVRRLHVRIGELSGVEIPLLRTAFETFRERTVCEAADLAIAAVPAEWRCPRCERILPPGALLRCCDRPARLAAGDDIFLDRIELEVPDV